MEFLNNSRLAQQLLEEAALRGASDLHVEPMEKDVRVRMRVDGLLQEAARLPLSCYSSLMTQFKVQGGMDIAEKRVPQDGRWQLAWQNRLIDLRLSTLPTIKGEKMAVRLLDQQQGLLHLHELALSPGNMELYKKMYTAPNGLLLFTGPTGSGKTTTLYATMQELRQEGLNLVTIEDPVEYKLSGVNQVAVNRRAGLDFSVGLRALVRQDPDIIMVGEIRDGETASMAVQAALTGHLVLSTLHTNSAVGAVVRLLDMGVEPYLLAAALRGVLAQRLVRRVCPQCAAVRSVSLLEKSYLGIKSSAELFLKQGAGCASCRSQGYHGRLAVQEVFPVDEYMAELISANVGRAALLSHAQDLGWHSLYEDGAQKVLAGLTTVQELWRAGIEREEQYVH